jgi:(p)ppGpp synthase/HD superfamily hydrolase
MPDHLKNSKLVHDAVIFAAESHHGQYRKGTPIPYICHPVNVMKILAENGLEPEYQAAGVLHDVLEDTDATIETIRDRFGPFVAELVKHASEQDRIESPDKSIPWRTRKQGTIDHILSEPKLEHLYVPLADKIDNILAIRNDVEKIGDALWSRFNAGYEDQKWYYTSLANAFTERSQTAPPSFLALAKLFAVQVDHVFNSASSSSAELPPPYHIVASLQAQFKIHFEELETTKKHLLSESQWEMAATLRDWEKRLRAASEMLFPGIN